jgi:hypothetical protein
MHSRTKTQSNITGRHSRFKNIAGRPVKKELWFTGFGTKVNKSAASYGVQHSNLIVSAESTVISASSNYFALPFGTYGQVVVTKYTDVAPDMKNSML